jgi:cell division protein FtsL
VTRRGFTFVLVLTAMVLASGVAVVYVKYLSRILFTELQGLNQDTRRLEEDWGLLRLEEAALSTHPRVEEMARKQLGMYLPRTVDVRTIEGVDHVR